MPDTHSASQASCTPNRARQHKTGCARPAQLNQGIHCSQHRHRRIVASCWPAPPAWAAPNSQPRGCGICTASDQRQARCDQCLQLLNLHSHWRQPAGNSNKQPDHTIDQSHWRVCRSMGLPESNLAAGPRLQRMHARKSTATAKKQGLMKGCQVVIAASQDNPGRSRLPLPHAPTSGLYLSSNAQQGALFCCKLTGPCNALRHATDCPQPPCGTPGAWCLTRRTRYWGCR